MLYPTDVELGKYIYIVTTNNNDGYQPKFIYDKFSIYEQMGFNINSANEFNGKGGLISANVIKLQSEDALYIRSDIVVSPVDDILQAVFAANSPSFGNITYNCLDIQACAVEFKGHTTSVYNFRLTDENDNDIELNGQNIILVLLLYKLEDTMRLIKRYIKYNLIFPTNSINE
jgi:hypothetical protein